ncbi:DUF6152 family protein [Candidatus Rariloculus sp.]|uniref:DUF6152 family protein n=1 Tax=Candidatus Rariloculus sp. TaxID=3101265 RepID=UPI003D0E3F68
MKKLIAVFAAVVSISAVLVTGRAVAHHSFAMFDLSQHMLVEGRITDWHFNNPHSWLYIEAPDENGEMQQWGFEGAARVHATRQGVNGNTFRKGELVRVIMSPIRDGRRAGAMCFVVKEDQSIAQPNDGICNAPQIIDRWESNGWLESASHLDIHPASTE